MKRFDIYGIPAILYGSPSAHLFLFIHGKYGCKEDAERFSAIACRKGYQVLSVDLPEHGERKAETGAFDPWHVVPELREILAFARSGWRCVSVRADSIGAYFSMLGFLGEPIERCLFVSPIPDMEQLILNLMRMSGITQAQLEENEILCTPSGETLSLKYLSFVRQHRITNWTIPTSILYGTRDNLINRKTIDVFVQSGGCDLTIFPGGDHWFHTPRQLDTLRRWTEDSIPDKTDVFTDKIFPCQ
jgi:pimeloyl-ACP methyl ester carboxylesterase